MKWWLILTFLLTSSVYADGVEHTVWDELLLKHVRVIDGGQRTQVDYSGFKTDRRSLDSYLEMLSNIDHDSFQQWPSADKLAFLINTYNAWTVELILTAYPDLESIKELGGFFQSPWEKAFISLFNKKVTLDHIEHDLIRGSQKFNEPRIHFAVNCASIGCPALRNEAYTAENLDRQLEQQTSLFLSDQSRNYLDDNTLYVSPIFKWYRNDFETGWRSVNSLREFLALYADSLGLNEQQTTLLKTGGIKIRFLDYDWSLNNTP